MFLFSPVSLNCSKRLFFWQHGNARKCLLHKRHLSQVPHEWQSVDCDTGLLPSVNWWHRLRGNIFNKLLNNFHKVLFIIVRIICWQRIITPQGRKSGKYMRCSQSEMWGQGRCIMQWLVRVPTNTTFLHTVTNANEANMHKYKHCLLIKPRKNGECCQCQSLTVSHLPSMSCLQYLNLSGTVNCVTNSLNRSQSKSKSTPLSL